MSAERKGLEFIVGLFLLLGLGTIAVMIIVFGRFGQGMQKLYPLTVKFPNASGLIKGSDVLLSGARVGVVTHAPQLIGDSYAVAVQISIKQAVRIPRKSTFQVKSSGMLGDSYVDVAVPKEVDPADYAQAGDFLSGSRTDGLDELTAKGGLMMDTLNREVLKKVSQELDQISAATASVRDNLLSGGNLKNLQETLENLKTTTAAFAQTSRDLDVVVAHAQDAIDATKNAVKTVDGTAGDVRLAVGDVRKLADRAATAIDSANGLILKAKNGEGTLGTLISDRQTADNLKSLVGNLRRSGVLFYKDRPLVDAPNPTPAPTPAATRRR